MIDISVNGLVKSFTIGDNLLDGLSFQVNEGERVGILGKNGCGKSTLFKILTREYDYDEGELSIAPGKRLGLISQIPVYPMGCTVEQVLDDAFVRVHRMERELERLTAAMAAGDSSAETMNRYDHLSHEFQRLGGYDIQVQINKVCNGLGISAQMREQPFEMLSGGEKTRVNLGRLILEDTDILLLDEPTNHLDLHAVEWLEDYLSGFKGTVLAISHDRYFLDKVVRRVVEIDRGKAVFYSGNYSFYVAEKERRYQEQLKQYKKEQAKIAQLTATATLMHQRGTEKQHKTAFAIEKRIERMRTQERPMGREKTMKAGFSQLDFQGDELFTLTRVGKSYGERTLFSDVSMEVRGGERIALLGDNGTGKTTFLNILLGKDKQHSGTIHFGPSVRAGNLPQIITFEHMERTLLDTMLYEQNCTAQEARDRLGAFLFRGDDVFKEVRSLSGGERSRLKLCILMDQRINLLVLDEPTNHLDIASREWMEAAVEDYDGALLFVSHDRYFINRFATRIWELKDGKITDFRGGYEAWLAKKAREQELRSVLKPAPEKPKKEKTRRGGGTKLLEKKLAQTEREIARVEGRISELEEQMSEHATDYQRLQELSEEQQLLEAQLSGLYQSWEELSLQMEEQS